MSNINIFFRNLLINKPKPLVKVYSHPRSGTHFLEAFIANNFYKDIDLSIAPITWGHWSDRRIKKEGNQFGQLFGNHSFAEHNMNDTPKIYIVRDGRAVAYSFWKTPNFLHENMSQLPFSEFLRTPLDWHGTPSNKSDTQLTILEHWASHYLSWLNKIDKNLLTIKYEDLVENPYDQYKKIRDFFFNNQKLLTKQDVDCIVKPVGLLPNKAKTDSWQEVFNSNDISFYYHIYNSYLQVEKK